MQIVYHRTSPEAAAEILSTRRLVSRENNGGIYVSDKLDGEAAGYGRAVVVLSVDAARLHLDDEWSDDSGQIERHYWAEPRDLGIVGAFEIVDGGTDPIVARPGSRPIPLHPLAEHRLDALLAQSGWSRWFSPEEIVRMWRSTPSLLMDEAAVSVSRGHGKMLVNQSTLVELCRIVLAVVNDA